MSRIPIHNHKNIHQGGKLDGSDAINGGATVISGGGGSHPTLVEHDALGLATDAELAAHAATPHSGGSSSIMVPYEGPEGPEGPPGPPGPPGPTGATGGGGGAPDSAKYIVSEADGTLSAEVVIPGLASSPDIASAGGSDDEFPGTNSFSSVLGSLDTNSATDRASNLHLAKTSAVSAIHGVYKACPSIPFTMTAKIVASDVRLDFNQVGIFVAEAAPGKIYVFGPIAVTSAFVMNANVWTNNTTRSTVFDTTTGMPVQGLQSNVYRYVRLVVASSTDISAFWSEQGIIWYPAKANANPGFTVGSVGLFVGAAASTRAAEAYFDWVRFT